MPETSFGQIILRATTAAKSAAAAGNAAIEARICFTRYNLQQ
jgi:hypothetical protein